MSNAAKLGLPEWLNFVIGSPTRALLIAMIITPGLMFLIGWVGESRTLPIGKNQFLGFFPGEFFLSAAFSWAVAGIKHLPETECHWYQSSYWHLTVGLSSFILGLAARNLLDRPNYTPEAMKSPTKLYHDFFLYIVYGFMMAIVAIPVVATSDIGVGTPQIVTIFFVSHWAHFVFVTDTARDPKRLAQHAHVGNAVPIWVTYAIRRAERGPK